MRYGFTTGSCATAAAKAAAYMLFTGQKKEEITIQTPKGIYFTARILQIQMEADSVSCAVEKDGGDDPDLTTGALIVAKVYIIERGEEESRQPLVIIDGAQGVGRVTKPGLDQPVGCAAINRVPRQMITKEVLEVLQLVDFHGKIGVTISIPQGEELAKSTFNPRLGIVGGLSILGTTGIVEPMSNEALLETIRVECRQKKALGYPILAMAPGNYGIDFMKTHFSYDLDQSVKCSNFIGASIDIAKELGFEKILLTGHIGKLVKVAGGILNTHSKMGDCRMELLSAAAIRAGCDVSTARALLDAVSCEEGVRILKEAGICEAAMEILLSKMMDVLQRQAGENVQIEVIVYAMEYGLLAQSSGAKQFVKSLCGVGQGL